MANRQCRFPKAADSKVPNEQQAVHVPCIKADDRVWQGDGAEGARAEAEF